MSKRYGVILGDPPWWYNARKNTDTRFSIGAWRYDLMADSEVLEMGRWVEAVAEDNSALFLWVTGPRLPMGVLTVAQWGFRFVSVAFVWVKLNARKGNLVSGPGFYTASNVELCLLGVRGSKLPEGTRGSTNKQIIMEFDRGREALLPGLPGEPDIVFANRSEHSRKPDIVRWRIEQMYPDDSRLELFCCHPAPDWDVWGRGVGVEQPLAEPLPGDDRLGYDHNLLKLLGIKVPRLMKKRPDPLTAPIPPWVVSE